MTNVHHLHVVGQGAGRWNAWRQQEPDTLPDLAGADLKGADLAGMDLTGAVLSLANLRKADLSGANLKLANLAGANMDEVNLSGAFLEGATIAGAYLLRANLSGACLRRVNLAGASLVGKINLSGADLTGANLAGARLVGAKLTGANLTRAILAGTDLREADLGGANLTDADTSGAKFDGANMSGTIIRDYRVGGRHRPFSDEDADEGETGELDFASDQLSKDAETSLSAGEADVDLLAARDARDSSEDMLSESMDATTTPISEPVEPISEAVEDIALAEASPLTEPVLAEAHTQPDEPVEMAPVSDASELLEPTEDQQATIQPPQVAPAPEEEADEGFYTYEHKDLAILMLYSEPFSHKTKEERHLLIDLLMQYNKILFGKSQISMATKGNSIIAGFESPTDALRCAGFYINILRDMKVESNVCVNWGFATVRKNMEDDEHGELLLNSIAPTARLRPIATSGEVLILEELFTNPATDKTLFDFEPVSREWTLSSDQSGPSVNVLCYRVRGK
jgi:uncharacterized protein YjbI with pentapeptide repeats